MQKACTAVPTRASRAATATRARADVRLRVEQLEGAVTEYPVCASSEEVRARVLGAIELQDSRFGPGRRNAHATTINAPGFELDVRSRALLQAMTQRAALSARSQRAVIRVARTIADLNGSERISAANLSTALQLARGTEDTRSSRHV